MKGDATLSEIQHLFHRLLRAPEGVRAGLAELVASGELEAPDVSRWIAGNDRLDATARLDLYASMYFYRLRDVLAEEFERTARRVGEVHFHNLITSYLVAHPPSAPSLREAGAALPDFLAGHALANAYPALADVARIERARLEVFDGLDENTLDRDAFLQRTAEDPEGFRLQLAAATLVLDVDARAPGLWSEPEVEPTTPQAGRIHVLVFRRGNVVYHRPCIDDEARCLEAIGRTPLTLSELAERLLKHDASAEETSEQFAALLERWAEDEVLVFPASPGAA